MENDYVEEYLPINGKKQYLLHFPCPQRDRPVVLFVPGGPGLGVSVYAQAIGGLRESCTLVCWDPLGAGKTLTQNPDLYPSMDALLKDMFIVVSCLKIKYWKDRIILLGHSCGSTLCSLYALRHPGDIQCCISAGPVVSIRESEEAGCRLLREKITAVGNGGDLKKLEKLSPYPEHKLSPTLKKMKKLRRLQNKYGLTIGLRQLLPILLHSPVFQRSDLSALLSGTKKNRPLWEFLLDYSLESEMRPYKIPVFFILGGRDGQSGSELAIRYLNRLRAPQKQAYTLPDAGHFMMLDQPAAFRDTLNEILGTAD